MKNPVSNIQIRFYTFPYKNSKVNKEPEIAVRLDQFVDIHNKKPGKYQGSYDRSRCPYNNIGNSEFES
jgi:hypothetical protein